MAVGASNCRPMVGLCMMYAILVLVDYERDKWLTRTMYFVWSSVVVQRLALLTLRDALLIGRVFRRTGCVPLCLLLQWMADGFSVLLDRVGIR